MCYIIYVPPQLAHLLLEQPRWEESAAERAKTAFLSSTRSVGKSLDRATADRIMNVMMGGPEVGACRVFCGFADVLVVICCLGGWGCAMRVRRLPSYGTAGVKGGGRLSDRRGSDQRSMFVSVRKCALGPMGLLLLHGTTVSMLAPCALPPHSFLTRTAVLVVLSYRCTAVPDVLLYCRTAGAAFP